MLLPKADKKAVDDEFKAVSGDHNWTKAASEAGGVNGNALQRFQRRCHVSNAFAGGNEGRKENATRR